MGGFTTIRLKDTSIENVEKHNKLLAKHKVKKVFRFYSEKDVKFEYDAFIKGLGTFPNHQFPKDKIKSYKDFTKYWSTEALGELFCPKFGTLSFDCYYNRTTNYAKNNIVNYLVDVILSSDYIFDTPFKEVGGSFEYFVEQVNCSKYKKDVVMTHFCDNLSCKFE